MHTRETDSETPRRYKPFFIMEASDLGYEVWAQYDPDSELYLVTLGGTGEQIGEVDSETECRRIAQQWLRDMCEE